MHTFFKSLFLSFVLAMCFLAGRAQPNGLSVPLYSVYEFTVTASANKPSPFTLSGLVGSFISKTGKSITIKGFYDGHNTWRLRFAPNEPGLWRYQLKGEDFKYSKAGTLICTKPVSNGFIGVHPKNNYAFAYSNGIGFFPMGDTSYGLFDDSGITNELRNEYLNKRRAQAFSFVRMEVGHSVAHAKTDNSYFAWGGTVDEPDLDTYNPQFFKKFDKLMADMQGKGMNVELILLNFYRTPFTTKDWTKARERNWIKYLLARYAAYNNVFMWTIANEYETHPDGAYRLDNDDVSWATDLGGFIKQHDPYHHLLTIHSVISSTTQGDRTTSPYVLPWQIGGFFGDEKSIDVLSQQTGQAGFGTKWNEQQQYWEGDDQTLTASIRVDREHGKPVINTENGYEYLKGQPTMRKQVHSTDKVRRSSWRIVCAGGYFAAGFSGTLAHNDIWNEIDKPNKYTFSLADEGAPTQLSYLYQFFKPLPFWNMQPCPNISGSNAVALQYPSGYVIYIPHGGEATLSNASKGAYTISWYNPRNGTFAPQQKLNNKNEMIFKSPDAEDWVALVKQL